jgi:Uma2 family endonuclease
LRERGQVELMSTAQMTDEAGIDYPETDGRPIAETPFHRDTLFLCIDVLRRWFTAAPNVYVSGAMMLYYERGNPRRWVSPDVQVTLGIPREPERRVYKTWVEGKMPDVIIEATSRSTQREDEEFKFELYRRLGVREYFLFDPEGDYLDPPLAGYRLAAGEYRPIQPVGGRLPSDVLRLHLQADGAALRYFDPATGQRILSSQEEVEQLRREVAALKQPGPPRAS